jgi:hypothetical protein
VPRMVSFFGVPRQGLSREQSMVAAKAIALAMRSIAAATAATTSNVVLRLISSFPSALVAFHAIMASRGSATFPTISFFPEARKGAHPYIRTPRQLYSPKCLGEGFCELRSPIHALLKVAYSANCTSLGELLSTPLPQTSVKKGNKTKKQDK